MLGSVSNHYTGAGLFANNGASVFNRVAVELAVVVEVVIVVDGATEVVAVVGTGGKAGEGVGEVGVERRAGLLILESV